MKTVELALLWLVPGAPLVVGLALWPFASSRVRGLVVALGAAALTLAAGAAIRATGVMLDQGGWSDVSLVGRFAGARVVAGAPLERVSLVLEPLTAAPAIAAALAALVALAFGATGAAPEGRRRTTPTAAQLCALLVVVGCTELVCLAATLDVAAGALAVGSVAAWAALVGGRADRVAVEAMNRLFATHRLGDGALLLGLLFLSLSYSTFEVDRAVAATLAVEPWTRAADGPLAGFPARWAWSATALLFCFGAATRLSLLPLPSAREAVSAAPIVVAVAQGTGLFGAAAVFLVRVVPLLQLAPEALWALGALSAATALVSAARASAEQHLASVDVLLATAAASLPVAGLAVGEVPGASFGAAFAMLVVVPLAASSSAVLEATGRDRVFELGGLWRALRRSDAARALSTAALVVFPGALVVERVLWAAVASPRRSVFILVVSGAALMLLAFAAYRALHLVFSGEGAPRGDAPAEATSTAPPRDASLARGLPPIALALLLVGAGLALVPGELVALVAPEYLEPYRMFVDPSLPPSLRTLALVDVPPPADPLAPRLLVLGVVLALALLGYASSALLYRGGPSRLHARLMSLSLVERARPVASRAEGADERATSTIVDSAIRLSRLVGLALLPVVLETLLQRLPALVATIAGALLRMIHNGDAQRAAALVVLALLALLATGRLT